MLRLTNANISDSLVQVKSFNSQYWIISHISRLSQEFLSKNSVIFVTNSI
jgi:hypothetical protein